MKILDNKQLWNYSPVVTAILFEWANIGQLVRMWSERTAAGQSLFGWSCVGAGLLLWVNWYRLFTPDKKLPRYTALLSVGFNWAVIATIVYFRYYHRT